MNFALFLVVLTLHGSINAFRSQLVSLFNAISVWWHVIGVAVIVVILIAVPSHHASFSYVFGHRINNSGFGNHMYWYYVLPLGFLLTMYTITGYDASAHVSEETNDAAESAPKGVWRSVFYSAVIGWIVLLAITFAIQKSQESALLKSSFPALTIFQTAMTSAPAKAVVLISTVGQLFCGMACVTSASRMTFAFSRDGAVPGHNLWRRLGPNQDADVVGAVRVPVRGDHHRPGLLPELQRGAGGVPRRDLDLGHRPLHRVHDPGVPALA